MRSKTIHVYNFVFPIGRNEIEIDGVRFVKHDDYDSRYKRLAHYVNHTSERGTATVNTGSHQHTATVRVDLPVSPSVFYPDSAYGVIEDLITLFSLFTTRDVFFIEENQEVQGEFAIVADPRYLEWGGVLACSIPYVCNDDSVEPHLQYDVGFEREIRRILHLLHSNEWKEQYRDGHYLLLFKSMIKQRIIEAAFIQCWTIWEHLFAVFNDQWMSAQSIWNLKAVEKIAFLLRKFALRSEIGKKEHKRLDDLASIRNRLIHFGMFPEKDHARNDALMFIRMTDFIVAKSLELEPSNLFNTVEKLEEFLTKQQKQANKNGK